MKQKTPLSDPSVKCFEPAAKSRPSTMRSASELPRPSRRHSDALTRRTVVGPSRNSGPHRKLSPRKNDLQEMPAFTQMDRTTHTLARRPAASLTVRASTYGGPCAFPTSTGRKKTLTIPPSSLDEADFETLSQHSTLYHPSSRHRPRSRAISRRSEVRKIRAKLHAEDARYVMVGSGVEFRGS